jgi:hypothetical protein
MTRVGHRMTPAVPHLPDSFLEPDFALPHQLACPPPKASLGVRRLAHRLLTDALRLASGRREGFEPSYATADARRWIILRDSGRLSFRWTCEVLGLDASAVAARVVRWG